MLGGVGLAPNKISDPGLSIERWLISYGKPYSCIGDSRTGLEAHQVDFGPILYQGAFWVVVLVPKETKVRLLVVWYRELVEHVFHICCNGIWVAPESIDYSPKRVVPVGALSKFVVDTNSADGFGRRVP